MLGKEMYQSNECASLVDIDESGPVLFRAEFGDEDKFISYKSMLFVLVSILLIFLYGVGIFFLMWLPVMYKVWRGDYRNRRLYITPENVVYKTDVPVCCPCFGSTKREKHILLSLVTDVILEQGCLQAKYGLHSIKLENAGQGGMEAAKSGADVSIVGISNAKVFKHAVLAAAAAKRSGMQITTELIQATLQNGYLTGVPVATAPPMGMHAHQLPSASSGVDPAALQALVQAQHEGNRTLREVASLLEKVVTHQQQMQ